MKKNKVIIIFSILAIFILADALYFLPLQISNLSKMLKDLKEKRAKLEALDRDIKNKAEFLKQKESLEDKLKVINKRFLSKNDTNLVMAKINELSKQMGLDISSIKPQDLQEISKGRQASFSYLPFILQLNTGYHRLGEFLNKLEKLKFSLELKELEIKGEFPNTSVKMVICGIVKE